MRMEIAYTNSNKNDEHEECDECLNQSIDLHKCPYKQEIEDSDEMCNCCEKCTYECLIDI